MFNRKRRQCKKPHQVSGSSTEPFLEIQTASTYSASMNPRNINLKPNDMK